MRQSPNPFANVSCRRGWHVAEIGGCPDTLVFCADIDHIGYRYLYGFLPFASECWTFRSSKALSCTTCGREILPVDNEL